MANNKLGTEVGRQMTKSQLAIKAWKKYKDGKFSTKAEAAKVIGTSVSSIDSVEYVFKRGDTEWIEKIYRGEKVHIAGIRPTDSIFTVKSALASGKVSLSVDSGDDEDDDGVFVNNDAETAKVDAIRGIISGISKAQAKRILEKALSQHR